MNLNCVSLITMINTINFWHLGHQDKTDIKYYIVKVSVSKNPVYPEQRLAHTVSEVFLVYQVCK